MELRPLSDFIEQQKEFITIEDQNEYKRITIKLHRKGIVPRDIIKGYEIKTKKQQVCKENQLLVAEIDAKVGGYGIVSKELENSIVSSHYFLFNINTKEVLLDYLDFVLKTDFFFSQIKARGTTNYAAIRPRNILKIKIPYCEIKQQKVIANKLRFSFDTKNKINTNIGRNKKFISNLRQAILREAFQGKLVPQDSANGQASVLLDRIKKDNEELVKRKIDKKTKKLLDVTEEEKLFDTPQSWIWTKIGDIFQTYSGSTPLRSNPAYYKKGIINWVKTTDLNNSYVTHCERQITEKAKKDYKLKVLPQNTVCLAMYGGRGTIGKSGILKLDTTINQSVCAILPSKYILPEFLHYYLVLIRANWMNFASSTRRDPNINRVIIKRHPFPLPPFDEQKRIVQKVDQLMELCDGLEEENNENQKNSNLLMSVVLRESFENPNLGDSS
jgi:restriction endonuclease S subunit